MMSLGTLVDTLRLASKSIPASSLSTPRMAVVKLSRSRVRYLDTQTDGPTVVIAPDPPNAIEHHLPMVEQLRQTHRVIVFDLPGFGFSYPRLGYGFTGEEISDTVGELLDALGIQDSTFLFSCLASHVALLLAGKRPDLVARLVLAQAPSLEDSLSWKRRMDAKRILGTPVVGQIMMAAMGEKVADGWYRAALPRGSDTHPYFEPAKTALNRGGCYCLASAFQRFIGEEDEAYERVEQPVTMFWGSADRTHRPSNPEGLLTHIPHAKIHVLEGCGHFPDLERTELILEAILNPG